MTATPASPPDLELRPLTLGMLFVATGLLGYVSGFPGGIGIVVALGVVAFAAGLRTVSKRGIFAYAPVPVIVVLVLEAATAPAGFGTELLAGLAGLAFLLWLGDDPARPAGGAARSVPVIALPALALGIAWTSELFLPAGTVPFGVAGALLAVVLAAVAFLMGRPSLFDREEART